MPLYNYVCESCGVENEHLVKFEDSLICPACGSSLYNRQLGAPGMFNLKGGGFYKNEYKAPCGIDKDKIKDGGCGGKCGC